MSRPLEVIPRAASWNFHSLTGPSLACLQCEPWCATNELRFFVSIQNHNWETCLRNSSCRSGVLTLTIPDLISVQIRYVCCMYIDHWVVVYITYVIIFHLDVYASSFNLRIIWQIHCSQLVEIQYLCSVFWVQIGRFCWSEIFQRLLGTFQTPGGCANIPGKGKRWWGTKQKLWKLQKHHHNTKTQKHYDKNSTSTTRIPKHHHTTTETPKHHRTAQILPTLNISSTLHNGTAQILLTPTILCLQTPIGTVVTPERYYFVIWSRPSKKIQRLVDENLISRFNGIWMLNIPRRK